MSRIESKTFYMQRICSIIVLQHAKLSAAQYKLSVEPPQSPAKGPKYCKHAVRYICVDLAISWAHMEARTGSPGPNPTLVLARGGQYRVSEKVVSEGSGVDIFGQG